MSALLISVVLPGQDPGLKEASEVTVPAAAAASAPPPARNELVARLRPATADEQAAAWEAELAVLEALEAAGEDEPPPDEERCGPPPGLDAGPPEEEAWLAGAAEPADGAGFGFGGVADGLAPGPVLARLAADAHAAGLGRLSDDELTGVLHAGRRLASWSAFLELSAAGELMRRRLEQQAAGAEGAADHADAEIAAALTLTGRAAGRLLDLAMALWRLPLTACALAAGQVDVPKAMVIAEETSCLDKSHAMAVEKHVLARAPGQTAAQLRACTKRAVLAADPAAARQHKERAEQNARVERWDEHAGTAALAGRDLPPAGVLAADHHLSELARALRAAGMTGTIDQLRAQAFLALLSGQPVTSLLPPRTSASSASSGPGAATATPNPASPGTSAIPRSAVPGTINLTMPLSTWLGLSESPGEVAGFGPLTADDSRDLAAAMAVHPRTRCCLTITDRNGRPLAHGCGMPRRDRRWPPGPGPSPPPSGSRRDQPGGVGPGANVAMAGWLAGVSVEWFETRGCTHPRESAGYRPAPSLRHLIRVRHQCCVFPGCRRPANRCDQDHTIAYCRGGRTCECNLAPLCRKHHQAKQAEGWRLDQPRPGILVWTTPSGRSHITGPASYPG